MIEFANLIEEYESFYIIFLVIALLVGWLLSWFHWRSKHHTGQPRSLLPKDYFVGLNYLLNEETDRATDVFIKMLEVNSDTVDAHLALGNLFCRKGDVEKAIKLHQNVIARPTLSKAERSEALLALARDYMSAGLFDRAENIFSQLIAEKLQEEASLQHLLDIHQRVKDWSKAIEIATRLQHISQENYAIVIAHYHCEIADGLIKKDELSLAKNYAQKALKLDKQCVRASLILGEIANQSGRYKEAIRCYRYVKQQDYRFLPEVLAPMRRSFEALSNMTEYAHFLQQCLQETPMVSIAMARADLLATIKGPQAAISFLEQYLKHKPSLKGLKKITELEVQAADSTYITKKPVIRELIEALVQIKPIYQCEKCGLSGKNIFWCCPKCKTWGSTKPIHGLEGE